jgi:hypothetical protein
MADYGAEIQPAQIDILADYLEEHLGRRDADPKGSALRKTED